MREEEIEKLRGVVRDCVTKHLYSSAVFFADKVAAFTNDPGDIYMQAQALFLGRHYRRAYHLLNASQIVVRDLRFRYLAAKCLEELKKWDQCILMLGDAKVDEQGNLYLLQYAFYEARHMKHWKTVSRPDSGIKLLSRLIPYVMRLWNVLLRITCLHATKRRAYFHHNNLVLKMDGSRYSTHQSFIRTLKTNTDLLACKAEYYHQCGEYQECFELTSVLLEKDSFHLKSTLVHLAAAMELGHLNELYLMACNLVYSLCGALSWFAVGCYYYCIKKYVESQRYFRSEVQPFMRA
ncbi:unnamed protein product [Malus baccata var. baccata]